MSTLLLSGVSAFPLAWYTTSKVTVTKTASSWQVTGSSISASPIYSASSTRMNCPCVEQIFTQRPDPRPGTEDWTLAITSFNKSDGYEYVRMTATAYTTPSSYYHPYPSPICRACYPPPPSMTGSLSATFPVDGVNTGFEWHGGGNTFIAVSDWLPISAIAGSFDTSTLYACVSVYNPMFDSNGNTDYESDLRQAWSEGKRRYISAGSFWGAVQFGKIVDRSGWVTSTYTATAVSATLHSSDKCMGVEDE